MTVPGSLIVPDSKPPVLLWGAGALLLAGLVIRALRRRRRRASSRGGIVLSSWQPAVPQGSGPMDVPVEVLRPRVLPAPVARTRLEEVAQKRGRAAKKRP
jgi:hypothetical protein